MTWALGALAVLGVLTLLAQWLMGSIIVYRGDGRIPCGHWDDRARKRLLLRVVTPTGSRWQLFKCRVFAHQLACCPNHATFIHEPGTEALKGMMCERCGGLIS